MSFNIEGGMKMSLIICPECGREVSSMAKACPQCGYPVEENTLEYQVRETIKEQSPVKAMEVLESRGYSPEEAHEYVWNYIEKYPDVLQQKIEEIIKEQSPIKAIRFLEVQGYSLQEAHKYVKEYIEKNPGCNIYEPPQPAPLQCPNCGSTSAKEALFSLYDHQCEVCGHEWVRCPKCGNCNIDITRVTPLRALKRSWNTCKKCGYEWRRP